MKTKNVNINMEKTKIMLLGGEERLEMNVEGLKLERVKGFKYLGAQIQNNGKQETEINERISTTMVICCTLIRNF